MHSQRSQVHIVNNASSFSQVESTISLKFPLSMKNVYSFPDPKATMLGCFCYSNASIL